MSTLTDVIQRPAAAAAELAQLRCTIARLQADLHAARRVTAATARANGELQQLLRDTDRTLHDQAVPLGDGTSRIPTAVLRELCDRIVAACPYTVAAADA
jgi:hypothetical protein